MSSPPRGLANQRVGLGVSSGVGELHGARSEVLRLHPQFSLAVHKQRMPIKDPMVLECHLAALRQARLK